VAVDLKSMFLATKSAVPRLVERGGGEARWVTGQVLVIDAGLTLTTR
jgi:hypothetical protein